MASGNSVSTIVMDDLLEVIRFSRAVMKVSPRAFLFTQTIEFFTNLLQHKKCHMNMAVAVTGFSRGVTTPKEAVAISYLAKFLPKTA